MPYLNPSAVVIHYEEALYQVYGPLALPFTCASRWNCIYGIHCVGLTGKNLVTAKNAREEKSVPSVDRLDTTAVLAAMIGNAPTAQVITLHLVRNVL